MQRRMPGRAANWRGKEERKGQTSYKENRVYAGMDVRDGATEVGWGESTLGRTRGERGRKEGRKEGREEGSHARRRKEGTEVDAALSVEWPVTADVTTF